MQSPKQPSAPTRSPSSGRAIMVAGTSTVLASLPAFLLGSLAVFIREDLGFGQAQLGFAVAVFFLTSAVTSVPGGRLTERIGARIAMLSAAGVTSVALVAISLTVRSYATLLAWMVVAGFANGLAQPAGNLALARGVTNARQGLAFGIKQSAIPGSTMLAGAAVPAIGLTVGWRWAFLGAVAGALLLAAVMPSDPYRSERPRPKGKVREGDVPTGPLVVMAISTGCGAGVGTSLPAFYVEAAVSAGLSPGPAGIALALGSLTGILVRLAMGWFADRRTGGHLPLVASLQLLGAVGFLGLATAASGVFGLTVPLALGTALGFGAGWGWPGIFNYAVVRLNPNAPAAATAITQTGVFAGGVIGPASFGAIAAATSFTVAYIAAAGMLVLAAVLVTISRRLLRRSRTAVAADGSGGGGARPRPSPGASTTGDPTTT